VRIREATERDAVAISIAVNEAFEADAFFKQPQYRKRLDPEGVKARAMMENTGRGCFLVAQHVHEPAESSNILGCMWTHWHKNGSEIAPAQCPGPVGVCSMVSVPPAHESRGVGTAMVAAAERKCAAALRAAGVSGDAFTMEIPVLSCRDVLLPWYQGQGYTVYERHPFNAPEIVQEGWSPPVEFIMLRKQANFDDLADNQQ
jgi:GNAT superfamily N-acetyltransferase